MIAPMTPRLWAAGTFAVLLVALAVVAALRVPWGAAPGPRADQVAALHSLPAEAVARGKAFHSALRPGSYGALAVALILSLILGLTSLGARLVDLVGRPLGGSGLGGSGLGGSGLGGSGSTWQWLGQALLGGLAVVAVGELATAPFAAWRQAVLRRYGLSTQDWGGWAVDMLKGYAVGAVIGAIALVGFFAVTYAAPRWWWAFGAAGAAVLMVALSFVFPVLVEPVFNRFTPMASGQLRTDLLALAARDGVPVRDVLVADASRRTRAVNAYVSGLGPTRRIVIYDTLLREAPPVEVEAVVAHELGHAKDGDVVTGTVLGALGAAAAVCGLYLLGAWAGLLRVAGVDSIAEPRAIALLLALAALASLATTPGQAYVSRQIEARADRHALALLDDPAAFEAMQARLSLVNLGDPDPNQVEHVLFDSHPSTVERMAAARAWARRAR